MRPAGARACERGWLRRRPTCPSPATGGLEALVAAAAPPLFHLVHEVLAVGGAGALGRLRPVATTAGIGAVADVLPGVDGGDRSGHHDHEAEDAEDRRHRDSGDQQGKTREEALANIREAIDLYLDPDPDELGGGERQEVVELTV